MVAQSIIPLNQEAAFNAVAALKSIVYRLRHEQMIEGQDFGTIPGTNDKPVLLLPGMEKLMRALNAVPSYTEKCIIRDYEKNLFHYEYECRLIDAETGVAIPGGLAIGLATSYETKWRWRKAERTCPTCGKPNIRKSKNNDGWYCWAKTGGCSATFPANMPEIINQPEGRVENDAICDQINTICKIAQKRALSSAIKGAAAVSEFFTVDLEDYSDQIITVTPEIIDAGNGGSSRPTPPTPPATGVPTPQNPTPSANGNGSHESSAIVWPSPEALRTVLNRLQGDTGIIEMEMSAFASLAGIGSADDLDAWKAKYATGKAAYEAAMAAFEKQQSKATPKTWAFNRDALLLHKDVIALYPQKNHREKAIDLLRGSGVFDEALNIDAAISRIDAYHGYRNRKENPLDQAAAIQAVKDLMTAF